MHYPAQVIAAELEQVISALYIASATGGSGGGEGGGLAPESVTMPPPGLTTRLLMDSGLSYGGTLSLYCALLSEAAPSSVSGSGSAGVVLLEVVQGQGLSVDPLESAIADDAYRLQLLESAISTPVQWLQVATKHSVARSRDGGSSDNALSELVRYNSTASSKSALLHTQCPPGPGLGGPRRGEGGALRGQAGGDILCPLRSPGRDGLTSAAGIARAGSAGGRL